MTGAGCDCTRTFPITGRACCGCWAARTDRDAVAAALRGWEAIRFEDAAAEAGLCVTAMRSFAEWDAHPQGVAVRAEPVIALERIGEAPPEGFGEAARPLAGLRVVDMTRVIAGPVCGRTMAVHGADVLLITAPHLHNPNLLDTSRGKRAAQLDLRDSGDAERLRAVLRQADVFLQGYRPGSLAARGFGPETAAALRPGIVCVSLAAFGHTGPWRGRRGFDSLNQTAIGLNDAEAAAFGHSRPAEAAARAGAGPCLGLFPDAGGTGGAVPAGDGWGKLARAGVARADRVVAAGAGAGGGWFLVQGADEGGYGGVHGRLAVGIRAADSGAARG